ncbi:uncharacterized protein RCC_04303 [Ramularia collo-cygni]|uniref:Uncharacterized protein n=1 Tax=Ramularia collo-cygni TaxID=112498 RepID=A0A2D3UTU2_9PEZI|nr:uncharacterized protein RCC_04303 [Ramularia collo-cygni]CZT18458.1 uncharacterized protein RCC_04303 [Ramularia collo-cygni]
MDDFSLQEELEALAGNAFDSVANPDCRPEPMKDTVARWQKLFKLPQDTAVELIMTHRNNLTRTRVSDDLWDTIRVEKESHGYDREAYEYELDLQKKKAVLPNLVPSIDNSESTTTYLVELSGALETVEDVQRAAGLDLPPPVVSGESVEDGRPVSLCCVDSAAKLKILHWASTEGGGFEPTILVDPRSVR